MVTSSTDEEDFPVFHCRVPHVAANVGEVLEFPEFDVGSSCGDRCEDNDNSDKDVEPDEACRYNPYAFNGHKPPLNRVARDRYVF